VVQKALARQHDAAEIAQMVKRGAELMANGDVAAARLMYQRAAETGDPVAAFALAETFDPLVLAKGGVPPDLAQARAWYEKARELGSATAPERLERLTRVPE
jgi:TPR repeat protein